MRTLFLLRHAKSSWGDPELADHDRPLNGRGRRACEAVGAWLSRQPHTPTHLLCSTARRARDTAARVAAQLEPKPSLELAGDLYLASALEMLVRVQALPDACERAMLVAHEPGIRDLALCLVGGGDATGRARLRAKFPTGAVAVIGFPARSWQEVRPDLGRLHEFVTPRELG